MAASISDERTWPHADCPKSAAPAECRGRRSSSNSFSWPITRVEQPRDHTRSRCVALSDFAFCSLWQKSIVSASAASEPFGQGWPMASSLPTAPIRAGTLGDGDSAPNVTKAKNAGDIAFKAHDYEKACNDYATAIALLHGDHTEADQVKVALLCNRSAALFKLGRHSDSASDAAIAIELAPDALKPRYRHACALHAIGNLEAALTDCRVGLSMAPRNRQLLELESMCSRPHRGEPPRVEGSGSSAKRARCDDPESADRPTLDTFTETLANPSEAKPARVDDWPMMSIPAYRCPPKPSLPAGIGALQELALSSHPDSTKVLMATRQFIVAYDVSARHGWISDHTSAPASSRRTAGLTRSDATVCRCIQKHAFTS